VYKHRSEDYIADVCNGVEQLQLELIGGLDSPREHWDGPVAWMSPSEHWGESVAWIVQVQGSTGVIGSFDSPREHWGGSVAWMNPREHCSNRWLG
jgi:hypothetical protein